jgi:hypothetical protein
MRSKIRSFDGKYKEYEMSVSSKHSQSLNVIQFAHGLQILKTEKKLAG